MWKYLASSRLLITIVTNLRENLGDVLVVDLVVLLQPRPRERLDGPDEGDVVGRDEGEGGAAPAGPGRPADAVHVVLAHGGNVVVDDVVGAGGT